MESYLGINWLFFDYVERVLNKWYLDNNENGYEINDFIYVVFGVKEMDCLLIFIKFDYYNWLF